MSNATTSTGGSCGSTTAETEVSNIIIKAESPLEIETSDSTGPDGEKILVIKLDAEGLNQGQIENFVEGAGIQFQLSSDGKTLTIINDCCDECIEGTFGCAYPDSPLEGDMHYDGGDSGWIETWSGTDWVRTCLGVGAEFCATSTADADDCAKFLVEECDLATNTSVIARTDSFPVVTVNGEHANCDGNLSACEQPVKTDADNDTTKLFVCNDGKGEGWTPAELLAIVLENKPLLEAMQAAGSFQYLFDLACAESEEVDPTDSSYILYCSGGEIRKANFASFLENVCSDLPKMDESACQINGAVVLAEDEEGCKKLFVIDPDFLPQGYKSISDTVFGTFQTILTGVSNLTELSNNGDLFYEEILRSSRTFTKAENPGLACVGTKLSIATRVYSLIKMTHENTPTGHPTHQWGFAVYANGVLLGKVGDAFFFDNDYASWKILNDNGIPMPYNTHAKQQMRAGEIGTNWTTTGDDLELTVVQYVVYNPTVDDNAVDIVDYSAGIDLAHTGIDVTLR